MERLLLALLLLTSAAPSRGGETWELVWVVRSTDWFIKQGTGTLYRFGEELRGELNGSDGFVTYEISVTLKDGVAEGTFEVVPGDAGPDLLKGTYLVHRDNLGMCLETIQLFDGASYVGLLRNAKCEP